MKNVRKHSDIKLVTKEIIHTSKFVIENLLAIEMKKNPQIIMNQPVHLGKKN